MNVMQARRAKRTSLLKAVHELNTNVDRIITVKEWARHMGYSRSYFSRNIKKLFRKSPSEILIEARLKKIKKAIICDPDAIGYKIAVDSNFIDDKALHKFLTTHSDMTFAEYREKVL